jgi:hypothetical protein
VKNVNLGVPEFQLVEFRQKVLDEGAVANVLKNDEKACNRKTPTHLLRQGLADGNETP